MRIAHRRSVAPAALAAFATMAAVLFWQAAMAEERPVLYAAFLVDVPGGSFVMGDADGEPNEAPKTVSVAPFRIMAYEATNAQFAAFVRLTGHVTDIEKASEGYVWTDKWRRADGADWRRPHGQGIPPEPTDTLPVVQVSARDAAAFCKFYGLRLPSEAEWEFAASGGDGRRFPWGNAPPRQSLPRRANFGSEACCAPNPSDGYYRLAPIGQYPDGVSPFGLHDMAGNVWEWTSDAYPGRPDAVSIRGGGWGNNPYCLRVSYRHWNPPDIGLDMVGFRCAGNAGQG
jgi:formylglycine-generating enzyme required for sulfatase activity